MYLNLYKIISNHLITNQFNYPSILRIEIIRGNDLQWTMNDMIRFDSISYFSRNSYH